MRERPKVRTARGRRSTDGRRLSARLLLVALCCLLVGAGLGGATASASAASAEDRPSTRLPPDGERLHRILVIFAGHRLLPANLLFDECLRRALRSSAGDSIECDAEFLDETRFPDEFDARLSAFLRAKYAGNPPELVVAFSDRSFRFCLEHRPQLFPNVPIVFVGRTPVPAGGERREAGVTGIRSSSDAPATLRLALRLQPRTQQVFLVSDAADDGRKGVVDSTLRASEFPVPFRDLTGRSFADLLEVLAKLPENSLVFDLSGRGGDAGGEARPAEAMKRISATSSAPIYGLVDPLVGYGLVGAMTTPMDTIGSAAAGLVREVLARAPGDPMPAERELAATPLVDWRQLRRWGLRKKQLPLGSIVRFEPPSFWRQYRLLVLTASGLFLLQTGLILALVLQGRRRRQAELDARRRREELAHMTRVATMGELTASLAHEINQPLAAILSNAQAGLRLLGAEGSWEEIREILQDIAADDQRAGEVIRRMRSLLRKEDLRSVELDVNALVDEVVALVHGEMLLQNVALVLELSPRLRRVQGDHVQLQQVLLNLLVNALDAMKETTGGNRRVIIRTREVHARSIEITVQDNGTGLSGDLLERIFEPFVTTKINGLGLGLAICRSIIQAHGGRIGARNNPDRGASFWVNLPAVGETRS